MFRSRLAVSKAKSGVQTFLPAPVRQARHGIDCGPGLVQRKVDIGISPQHLRRVGTSPPFLRVAILFGPGSVFGLLTLLVPSTPAAPPPSRLCGKVALTRATLSIFTIGIHDGGLAKNSGSLCRYRRGYRQSESGFDGSFGSSAGGRSGRRKRLASVTFSFSI